MYTMMVVKFARNNGYVETITGRRRYLDHINSGEPQLKSMTNIYLDFINFLLIPLNQLQIKRSARPLTRQSKELRRI